jgi:hypothetical protein|tara:strand:- start:2126 stop:2680 length:555 start_codon:yes stop_codon:yes gene_type:complete
MVGEPVVYTTGPRLKTMGTDYCRFTNSPITKVQEYQATAGALLVSVSRGISMKHLLIAGACVVVLALGGCASIKPVDPDVLASADYGSYPDNYEATIKSYFEKTLKDPFSAQYRFQKPFKAFLRKAPIMGGEPVFYGYMVYTKVNAKNGFGAYTGWEEYRLLIHNRSVVGRASKNPWFSEEWYK